jgi:hypothetical protein
MASSWPSFSVSPCTHGGSVDRKSEGFGLTSRLASATWAGESIMSDVVPDPDAARPVPMWRDALTVIGQVLGLVALLLPVAGAIIRWIAFTIVGSFPDPAGLALAAPLSELVATATSSLLPPALTFAVSVGIVLPARSNRDRTSDAAVSRRTILRRRVAELAGGLLALFIVASIPLPQLVLLAGSGLSGLALGVAVSRARRLTFGSIAASAGVLVLAAAITGGLSLEIFAARYTFESAGALPDGDYLRLATFDGMLALRACDAVGITLVPLSRIQTVAMIDPRRPKDANLWESLSRGAPQKFGLHLVCP